MVDVPVDDEDAAAAERLARVRRRDRDRVEHAETHRLVRLRVVARRAHQRHPVARGAAHDRLGELEHGARGDLRAEHRARVEVDGLVLVGERVDRLDLLTHHPLDPVPVAVLVHELDLLARHQPRRDGEAVRGEAAAAHRGVRLARTLRTLRVVRVALVPVEVHARVEHERRRERRAIALADGEPKLVAVGLLDGEQHGGVGSASGVRRRRGGRPERERVERVGERIGRAGLLHGLAGGSSNMQRGARSPADLLR